MKKQIAMNDNEYQEINKKKLKIKNWGLGFVLVEWIKILMMLLSHSPQHRAMVGFSFRSPLFRFTAPQSQGSEACTM